ncbi:hypothetical protein F8M41_015829 [Gigaspora margarita]|uniref:Uncharacterized protein n=1 Tax=Gigaspora margarita TaxID=4874 RepID=A0A8H4AQ35_GIGMA|nr:hypothetical protein F8M41_015829 [Gigaspora margarita]
MKRKHEWKFWVLLPLWRVENIIVRRIDFRVLSGGLFIGVFSHSLVIGFIGAFFGGLCRRVLANAFYKNAMLTTLALIGKYNIGYCYDEEKWRLKG